MPNSDQICSFTYQDVAVLNDYIVDGVKPGNNIKITKMAIFAREAPTGAALQVTLTKNSVPTAGVANLSAGSTKEVTNIPDQVFNTTDAIGLQLTQIGSILEGVGILVTIHYEKV